jgi:hypothetical protein
VGLQWDRQPRRAGFSRSFLKLRAGVLFGQLEPDRGPTQAPLLRFEAAPARFRSYISSGRAVGASGGPPLTQVGHGHLLLQLEQSGMLQVKNVMGGN